MNVVGILLEILWDPFESSSLGFWERESQEKMKELSTLEISIDFSKKIVPLLQYTKKFHLKKTLVKILGTPEEQNASQQKLRFGCNVSERRLLPLVKTPQSLLTPLGASTPNPTRQNPTRLRESHVAHALRREPSAERALLHFQHVSNALGFTHTPLTYAIVIDKLSRAAQNDAVHYLLHHMKLHRIPCSEDTFISVLDSHKRASLPERALKTFYRIREFGCSPTVRIYNHLLDALLCHPQTGNWNALRMVGAVYQNMRAEGLDPNVFTYNVLLKALCLNGNVDAACKLLVEMSGRGCPPDEVSYTTVVSAVCRFRSVEEAREVAGRFGVENVVSVYNALICGLCREGRIREVFHFMGEMVGKGVDPDVVSYSSVISSLADVGEVELGLAVFGLMVRRGCRPNVHTFSSLMKGCFLGGRVREGVGLWRVMVWEGVRPNVVACNTLLYGLCCSGNVAEAVEFCDSMERDGLCRPNVTSFSTLVHGFARSGDLQGASGVWNRMVDCGVRPNVVAYTSMVDVLCRNSMFGRAWRLIESMTADGCPPTVVTFNTFVKGLCRGGRVRWAMRMVDQMQEYGCLPDIRTYNELLDGLFGVDAVREACEITRELEERKVEMNSVTYNTVMYGFSSHGMQERVWQVLGRMFVNGVKPDDITVNIIIYAYSKLGRVRTAIQLLDKITERKEICPDIIAHTGLLWGICNWLSIEEAIVYLNKMLNNGIFPNIATWDVLVRGLFNNLGHMGPIRILDDILGNG
ncbi:hypothetical protein Fmac_001886 [Flemingia macrophylla]|uniref:Pentatricopeptide repeat-containing protein n=1 Tax=Flemingia macrophylla TaxID=520843 RepID=A0ABD1NIH7_9FABA